MQKPPGRPEGSSGGVFGSTAVKALEATTALGSNPKPSTNLQQPGSSKPRQFTVREMGIDHAPEVCKPTPVKPRLAAFLERVNPARGRVILYVDATASRQPTWDTSAQLQAEMFAAVPAGLDVQLVYYRGNECVTSQWFSNTTVLAAAMRKVMCQAGHTQLAKVLRHTQTENQRDKVGALIVISDACEEDPDTLYLRAVDLHVPIFLFQEGTNPAVAAIYDRLARITGGAFSQFNQNSAQHLADLLRAVAAFASGGIKALTAQQTEAATLLLTQIKK